MSDLKYLVDIEMNVDEGGRLSGKIGRIGSAFGPLNDAVGKVGGKLVDAFEGAVEKAGSLALTMGKIGLGAGVAAVTYGVMGLNQELETTQVSLAAVLNANQIGGGMAGAMGVAAGWMRQMKQDARDLPGEFSDLLKIVQSGASAAFNAGLDVDRFEKVASQGMAAAKAMSVPIDQAGRELAMLLEGRAGAHNVFGTRLGIHAADMKGKTPEQRVQLITDAIAKFEPAIKAFGDTMDAQSSTLVDNAKTFLGAATLPLFNRIKGTIGEANDWLAKNQDAVQAYAIKIGDKLEEAFDRGKAVVMEYGPLILDFGSRAYDEIASMWKDAEPYVKSIGEEIKSFLKDDSSLDKIKTILELYIAAKGVGGVASVVGTVGPLVKAIGPLVGGGAEAAGAAGEAGAGGGGAIGALASIGAAALGIIAAGAAAVGVSVHYAGRQEEREQVVRDAYLDNLVNAAAISATSGPLGPASGIVDTSSREYTDTVQMLRAKSDQLADSYVKQIEQHNQVVISLQAMRTGVDGVATALFGAEGGSLTIGAALADRLAEINARPTTMLKMDAPPIDPAAEAKRAEERRKQAAKGTGGTVIHKVEISVSTNQNPGQVARTVGAYLAHDSRFRTSSPYTRSFAAPSSGI